MTRVLSAIMLWLFLFCACSEKTEDVVAEATYGMYESPYSNLSVSIDEEYGSYIVCIRENGKRSKKVNLPTYKKEIDKGYGEVVTCETRPERILFLKNRIIVYQHSSEGKFTAIDLFTNDLEYIKGIKFENICIPLGWNENTFLIENMDNRGILEVMNDEGVVIRELNESPEYRHPYSTDSNIFFDNYEYIAINKNDIKRYGVESGLLWSVTYAQHVKNKPETETNNPRIQYMNYSIKDNIVSINLDVTYYSGEKEKITLKIDSNSGEVIQ